MKQLRSIGAFLITSAAICGLIAYERYSTAKSTAMAVAETLEGVEFDSVGLPPTTIVAGLAGVILLVAGTKCFADSLRSSQLLQVDKEP